MNLLSKANKKALRYGIELKGGAKASDPRAIRSLLAIMNQHAVNGGAACHWGGPSAMVEAWSALHSIMFESPEWYEKYNFVNDIGHAENGLYAIRALYNFADITIDELKTFRKIQSRLTGHGESHLFPEAVLMSNGPLGSSVGQAQGLAMADRKTGNDRITVLSLSDGACMEGESKEALSAIPALANKGLINPFILLISDNQTKLSGRIIDAFDMNPSLDSLYTLGWKVIDVFNGNSIEDCYEAISKALKTDPKTPICVRLRTQKGYGIKETAESASGGHGYPLKAYDPKLINFLQEIWQDNAPNEFLQLGNQAIQKNEETEKKKDSPPEQKVQVGVANAIIKLKNEGLPLVSISSDLQGSTGLAAFHKAFPGSSFDIGIAESNMVSVAAGFSKNGFIPMVDTFAAFGITKGNLPLIMASLSSSPIVAFFSHTGFQDAADGASHQSLTYFSAIASIPNVKIICLSHSQEAETLVELEIKNNQQAKKPKSLIFFLGRETFPVEIKAKEAVSLQRDQLVIEGKDGLIAASGPLLFEALEAGQILKQNGLNFGVINHRYLNEIDSGFYQKTLQAHSNNLFTLEDHQVNSGIGSFLLHKLISAGVKIAKFQSFGVEDQFGQSSYTALDLYKLHQIDGNSVAKRIIATMTRSTRNE